MNLDNFANVGELVAATATVITLIFVAFELRANRRQNRLVMLTGLDKGWNDINVQMMQDDILPHLFFKSMSEPDSLTDEEASRFWILMKQLFDHHKSVWALLTKDGLQTHHEQWLRTDISSVYNTPGGWKVFLSFHQWAPPEFLEYVEKHRETKVEFSDWRQIQG
jgi:hypothetical protein